jgi:hypothetical protein
MQFNMIVTNNGKHPAAKWAEMAANELIDIGSQSPDALIKEANTLKVASTAIFEKHHQVMMDHEQDNVLAGKHDMDLPYDSEAQAKLATAEIVTAAKGTSFVDFFNRADTQAKIEKLCNHYFKSAMLVERSHFHSENAL